MTVPRASGANKIVSPYGNWRAPQTPAELFAQPAPPAYPFRHQGVLHWLQALPAEGGRTALWRESARGARCLTPRDFDIRTRANEYGGRCFCVLGDAILFNNAADGRLYQHTLTRDTPPQAITAPSPQRVNFADLIAIPPSIHAPQPAVAAVMETAEADGTMRACIALIPLASRGWVTPLVLAEGSDFYANLVGSPAHDSLAWLEWEHPYMPWDQTRLVIAKWNRAGTALRDRRILVDTPAQSVCQIGFLRDGALLFASDSARNDRWNFFRYHNGDLRQLTFTRARDAIEFGEAHWQFGQTRWQQVADNTVLAVGSQHRGDQLVEISLHSGATTPRDIPLAAAAQLWCNADELLYIARYADRPAAIRAFTITHRAGRDIYPPPADAPPAVVPRPLVYPTADGARAYAYFYAPQNAAYTAPPNTRPPLLVMVHGGPTGRATPEWHPVKQFFAARGYAILDVNHRGSTGYGRAYRQSLLGQWGEADIADIANGIDFVVQQGWASADAVFIRGGSAGGYTVLRMLTQFPALFRGGACYYGIGNLITLARATHKFERYYTDQLIGEKFQPNCADNPRSQFILRSPIFQLGELACPLILFQGLQDNVVPPAVAREIVAVLQHKNIPHAYVEYEHEGHGFRSSEARVDSLTREAQFFAQRISA